MMEGTNTAGNLANDGNAAVLDEQPDQAVQTKKGRGKRLVLTGSLVLLAICLAGIGYVIFREFLPKRYQNYTVRLEQYFVEYSEEYDYWDVLTVDLLTGEAYELTDILEVNREFLPCKDKQENIWLGEGASIWDWDY